MKSSSSDLRKMEDLLSESGYNSDSAKALLVEGMGPSELAYRLKDKGSLQRSHGLKRLSSNERFKVEAFVLVSEDATFTKLRDGTWGLRVPGIAREGQSIRVKKKGGEVKTETVGRVLWKGDGISLCTIGTQSSQSTPRRRRPGGRYECDECGEIVNPGSECWETGMMH